jgi:hypothetical protein
MPLFQEWSEYIKLVVISTNACVLSNLDSTEDKLDLSCGHLLYYFHVSLQ